MTTYGRKLQLFFRILFSSLSSKNNLKMCFVISPDTFIYTTADQSGFLLPQTGAYFVINHEGSLLIFVRKEMYKFDSYKFFTFFCSHSQGVIFWPNPLTQMRVRCRMAILWVS